jgi:hypothetical protein
MLTILRGRIDPIKEPGPATDGFSSDARIGGAWVTEGLSSERLHSIARRRTEMRPSRMLSRSAVIAVTIGIGAAGMASSAGAQGKLIARPIGDFISAQGKVIPPPAGFSANFIGWIGKEPPGPPDGALTGIMTLDYAGLDAAAVNAARGAGTVPVPTIAGIVIERALASGQTNVKIRLETTNELAYIHHCGVPIPDVNICPAGEVAFGVSAEELEAGADPARAAYGSSRFGIEYNVSRPPGAPMEDLIQLFFGGLAYDSLPITVTFSGSAEGELRAPSGCPEGTPGRAWAVQTGLIAAGFHSGFKGALALIRH